MGRKGGRQKLKEKREGKQKKWRKCPLHSVERFLLSHKFGGKKRTFRGTTVFIWDIHCYEKTPQKCLYCKILQEKQITATTM